MKSTALGGHRLINNSFRASQSAFNRIAADLDHRDLYRMSQLREEEQTWQNLISCSGVLSEAWELAADEYDRELFTLRFFAKFKQVWNGLEAACQ